MDLVGVQARPMGTHQCVFAQIRKRLVMECGIQAVTQLTVSVVPHFLMRNNNNGEKECG